MSKKPEQSKKNSFQKPSAPLAHTDELAKALSHAAQKATPMIKEFYSTTLADPDQKEALDPLGIQKNLLDFYSSLARHPDKLISTQIEFMKSWRDVWQDSWQHFFEDSQTLKPGSKKIKDRRFKNTLWSENAFYDFIKRSYLLTSETILRSIDDIEDMDTEAKRKIEFVMRQYVDALAPSNYFFTNPEILQETIQSGGENLVRGLENLLTDIKRGQGHLDISKTDYSAFKTGENLATTKGEVIYQNELMQLIQYTPKTNKVFKEPLLIIPPWINKYYILDLRQDNSFVNWLVEQGHTVFMISWVNPDSSLSDKGFEDYLKLGPLKAIKVIQEITGEESCHTIGYCIGGTLLASALAWYHADPSECPVKSATFLTTLLDFEKAGDLKVFTDDSFIDYLEQKMDRKGYLEASSIRNTFSLLRPSDLIWSFVINNYFLGKDPMPFDILYWNDDATNMPAKMHLYYLKNMYRDNLLAKNDALKLLGRKINLEEIKTPSYILSTQSDHIAPWKATYESTKLLGGPVQFTLASSGHIAGVVNPPKAKKYSHFTYKKTPYDPDQWLSKAQENEGSWWPHWQKWIHSLNNQKAEARTPGSKKYPPLEKAPGSYVKIKA